MKIAIILGGGKGTRAGGPIPKQFQLIGGAPVLLHSIKAMTAGGATRVYVVLPLDYAAQWQKRIITHSPNSTVVLGGATRWHSVANALQQISNDGFSSTDLIAIHDGARPLVPTTVVQEGWRVAEKYGAAVPAIPVTDSLRQISDNGNSKAIDRNQYRAVQTPQIFNAKLLTEAYSQPYNPLFTDDASVVEKYGHTVKLFNGDPLNIKITQPGDLEFAEILLAQQAINNR